MELKKKTDPGKRRDFNLYATPVNSRLMKGIPRLPLNLLDALRFTEKSKMLRLKFGDESLDAFLKLHHQRWLEYTASLSKWEIDTTFDC